MCLSVDDAFFRSLSSLNLLSVTVEFSLFLFLTCIPIWFAVPRPLVGFSFHMVDLPWALDQQQLRPNFPLKVFQQKQFSCFRQIRFFIAFYRVKLRRMFSWFFRTWGLSYKQVIRILLTYRLYF